MGEVWEADDTVLERPVAVKLVIGDRRHEPTVLTRFEREARTGARLAHPALATVYDFGEADEGAYLVMELLSGETLAERLRRGPLPVAEAAAVVADAAEALAVAHAAGVSHRDVKPSNLMLTDDGTKVMDFGIASGEGEPLTATGLVIGTADYLAPERAQGRSSGPEADVYALGAVLVEAITGQRAFEGATPGEVALAQVHAEPPDLAEVDGVPAEVAAAARDALAKDPGARPSAVALAARLRGTIGHRPVATTVVAPAVTATQAFPAPDPTPVPPEPPPTKAASGPGPWPVVIGLVLLVALLAGGALLLADDDDPGTEAGATPTTNPAVPSVAPTVATTAPPPATTVLPTTVAPTTTTPPATTVPGTEEALLGATVTYIDAVAAGDFDTAWALTSPAFQAAQDRASWEGFWDRFESIERDGDPRVRERDAGVDLPLLFDGHHERYRLTFVEGPDGAWLVDGPIGR
jgi:serine/threonine-protein kinase